MDVATDRPFSVARALANLLPPLRQAPAAVLALMLIGALGDVLAGGLYIALGIDDGIYTLLVQLGALVGGQLAIVGLTWLTLRVLARKPGDLRDSLDAAVRFFLPSVGLSLLAGLSIALGLVALVIPGLVLIVGWSVVLPCRITGKPGASAAMHASWTMTKGSRWPIAGVLLVGALLYGAVYGVNQWAVQTPRGFFGPWEIQIIVLGLNPIAGALETLILALFPAAIFHELKYRGGDVLDETSEVFA